MQREYREATGKELVVGEGEATEEDRGRLEEMVRVLESKREHYVGLYELQKRSREMSQMEREIEGEVKRAREAMP